METKIKQQEQTNREILIKKDAEILKLVDSITKLNAEFSRYKEQKRNPTFVQDTTNTTAQQYQTQIEELKKELVLERTQKKKLKKN